MVADVVVDRAFALVDAVRFQLPLSCELLLALDLFLLLGLPSAVDLGLLNLTVLLIAPLRVLLRRALLILCLRRASLICSRLLRTSLISPCLLRTSLVVAWLVISLRGLSTPLATRSPRRLRRRLLVLILATAPIAGTALGLSCRRNEEQRCSR